MTATGGVLELSRDELLACWAALGLGEPPALLQLGGAPGLTVTDRYRHLDTTLAGTRYRGLVDGAMPVPWLAGWLRLLAGPERQLDIRFTGPTKRPAVALAALADARGLAVLDIEPSAPLQLLAVDPARAIPSLLDLLGPIEPGRGTPVNIPADLLDEASVAAPDGDLWALADRLTRRGVPRTHASSLARMCTGINGGGQLGAITTVGGRRHRAGWVIGFHRTDVGWFSNVRRDHTVTVCPTDTPRLARHWHELASVP
jgi:hypothetical protein